jgi:hypothetical protein
MRIVSPGFGAEVQEGKAMLVKEAQRELRDAYFGGALGPLISGVFWIVATLIGIKVSKGAGIYALVILGMFIFPTGLLILKLMGRPFASKENPLNALATQIAFTIPASYPVIFAATIHNVNWFFPAMAVIVGAHYLPFIFLYGMKIYGAIAIVLIAGATFLGLYCPGHYDYAGWFTGAVLLLSSPAAYLAWKRTQSAGHRS